MDFYCLALDHDSAAPGTRSAHAAFNDLAREGKEQKDGGDIREQSRQDEQDASKEAEDAADRRFGPELACLSSLTEFAQRLDPGMADGQAARHEAQKDREDGKPGAEPLAGLNQKEKLQQAERKKDKKYGSDHLKPVGH